MGRVSLTQQQLEDLSGVDRTWISKLKADAKANPTIETYDKLDAALRARGALRRGEKLVFGQSEPASRAEHRAPKRQRARASLPGTSAPSARFQSIGSR